VVDIEARHAVSYGDRRTGFPGRSDQHSGLASGIHLFNGVKAMVTITLMGQLQTEDGERDFTCEVPGPVSVKQLIQRQGMTLRPVLQLLREKKVLVTVNKRIASEDSLVNDGDAVRLVGHDGMGGTGLGPSSFY
jgi:molybdopterin converting factor small subunit